MKKENLQQSFEITFREVDEIDLKEHPIFCPNENIQPNKCTDVITTII